jgi:hypothetical protein
MNVETFPHRNKPASFQATLRVVVRVRSHIAISCKFMSVALTCCTNFVSAVVPARGRHDFVLFTLMSRLVSNWIVCRLEVKFAAPP